MVFSVRHPRLQPSLAEDHSASTVITQQFPSVGNTGMTCLLGSERGIMKGREKKQVMPTATVRG